MSNSSTLELARRFVRALNEKDEATIRQIYAPDARIWHNFDDKYQTLDENMRGMYWIHKRMSGINYDVEPGRAAGRLHPGACPARQASFGRGLCDAGVRDLQGEGRSRDFAAGISRPDAHEGAHRTARYCKLRQSAHRTRAQ